MVLKHLHDEIDSSFDHIRVRNQMRMCFISHASPLQIYSQPIMRALSVPRQRSILPQIDFLPALIIDRIQLVHLRFRLAVEAAINLPMADDSATHPSERFAEPDAL